MKKDQFKKEEKCKKKFLWFRWFNHDFEQIDISEEVKKIGKDNGEYKQSCFIRRFITRHIFQCKICGKKKTETEIKEEIIRRYY